MMIDRQRPDVARRPELHHAVRERYRQSLRQIPSQRQAFDLATELLRECEPWLRPGEARTIVARMLATEPMPAPALGNPAAFTPIVPSPLPSSLPAGSARRD